MNYASTANLYLKLNSAAYSHTSVNVWQSVCTRPLNSRLHLSDIIQTKNGPEREGVRMSAIALAMVVREVDSTNVQIVEEKIESNVSHWPDVAKRSEKKC